MVTESVRKIIDDILEVEGEEYTNDSADSGGPTKWGVTQKIAALYGVKDVRNLTREQAFDIYYQRYVREPKFEEVLAIAPLSAAELIDTGVNCGPGLPSRWLQEWLNAFNNNGALYKDVAEDGSLGPRTMAALSAFIRARGVEGDKVLATSLNSEQAVFYKDLSRKRPKDERFMYGWVLNRVLDQALSL